MAQRNADDSQDAAWRRDQRFNATDERAGQPPVRLFSVGHSNQSLDSLLGLLRLHRIDVLVDVRSQPYSRYTPHFTASTLKPAVIEARFRYLFLGRELGGRPEGLEFYDELGHVRYDRVADSPVFLEGLHRLEQGASKYRIAILCSEESPAACHRRLLIGRALRTRGVELDHIRADGSLQTEDQLAQSERGEGQAVRQTALFDDQEVTAWRSTRSVSPRSRQPTSSEH